MQNCSETIPYTWKKTPKTTKTTHTVETMLQPACLTACEFACMFYESVRGILFAFSPLHMLALVASTMLSWIFLASQKCKPLPSLKKTRPRLMLVVHEFTGNWKPLTALTVSNQPCLAKEEVQDRRWVVYQQPQTKPWCKTAGGKQFFLKLSWFAELWTKMT